MPISTWTKRSVVFEKYRPILLNLVGLSEELLLSFTGQEISVDEMDFGSIKKSRTDLALTPLRSICSYSPVDLSVFFWTMAASPYRLSCTLSGHALDVRSVAVTWDGKIISGSRDKTAKIWTPETGRGYRETMTFNAHKNFVSCVCTLLPNQTYPNGLIITGSNDHCIRLFSEESENPLHILKDHSNTVCKLVVGQEENTVLSSSWDNTAKLWNLKTLKLVVTFSGHEMAVWSVLQLQNGAVITASADKKIKIWSINGSCLRTLTGHTDCVRDLAPFKLQEFLSCSNDATVRHWHSETGDCLNIYYGHCNFIYSISPLGHGFVTSSEDRTVKVWNNGEVSETISIPAYSIWSVISMANGDIVTGSSDGMIRVFSSDVSRQASAEELLCYDEQLDLLGKGEVDGLKVSDLPGQEALSEPGKKDGQTKLINEDNVGVAYAWSDAEQKWNKMGTVVGSTNRTGVSASGRPVHDGKEYDYVFSVDVEEGKPPLKLPYNKNDDPWQAAQSFIEQNHLCQEFLDEVANFIIKNSNQTSDQSMPVSSSEYTDPFTGSARYVPQTNNVGNMDFHPNNRNISSSKPYTDSSNDINRITYFPQREFLKFDQANLNVILEKLLEFNRRSGDGGQLVKDSEIEDLMKICEAGAECTPENILTLSRLLEWPEEIIFPVLDVLRLAIRNTDVNSYLCNDDLIPALMKFLAPGTSVPPNNMLALRVLSNMLASDAGQTLAEKNKIKLINIIKDISGPYIKTVQVAMATLLLNMAIVIRRSETVEGRLEALTVTQQILPILTDQEALFRALVALGTLLDNFSDSKNYSSVFRPILVNYQNDSALGKKIQDCSQQILLIL